MNLKMRMSVYVGLIFIELDTSLHDNLIRLCAKFLTKKHETVEIGTYSKLLISLFKLALFAATKSLKT